MWEQVTLRRGFVIGLDLGQANDFTALTIVDRVAEGVASADEKNIGPMQYEIPHLQRFKLGTPYPDIAAAVGKIMVALPKREQPPRLIVDATGVGRPVVDLLKKAKLHPTAVTITGGSQETSGGDFQHGVPKRNSVSALQVTLQTGRLKIARKLPEASTLINELLNFKVKISASGHDSYEAWRESIHDDLVLSASLAVWWSERHTPAKVSSSIYSII